MNIGDIVVFKVDIVNPEYDDDITEAGTEGIIVGFNHKFVEVRVDHTIIMVDYSDIQLVAAKG